LVVTRFAPSPTGPLHLGHAYAAIFAHDRARASGGRFLLRIEDIDRQRSKPAWERACLDDLAWLGLTWDSVMRQSQRQPAYDAALDALWARGLLYPCRCTRRDIDEALGAPQEGVLGPDGPVYPGTCRAVPLGPRPLDQHLRLNMKKAVQGLDTLFFHDDGIAVATLAAAYVDGIGDIILARRDFGTSYHLSVVLDDAAQGVTLVTRGADLREATAIHRLLQHLLGLPVPDYLHHGLIRDDAGKRLAKRDDARALAKYRAEGASPEDIRRMVGLG
jgi:glutamyl-Q tRNA(Asp) synthetase